MTSPPKRPTPLEFGPFYAGYIAEVPEGDVLELLRQQEALIGAAPSPVSADQETLRYAPGKWSVREVFGHLGDAERVFGYRAFCISRGDQTPLPAFDEERYVANSSFASRPLRELTEELVLQRRVNLRLFQSLSEEAWRLAGVANSTPVSVRALAFIIAGHMNHHLRILRERYGLRL